MAALAPGQQLGQRFTSIRPLGEGGMGVVWLVQDHELEERVVIKLLLADAPPEWVALLKRECRNARRLVHPNIVRVYDLHYEDPHRFISMAYVEGDDISQLRGRPLPEILASLLPVADALDYAHRQGIVHRDLKSTNVLLDANGEPRLVDFGIAGLLGTSADNMSRAEDHEPTPSDDIYGLGGLLYELLSDRAEPLPKTLASLMAALLSTHEASPFQTMGEVKDALQDAQRELGAPPAATPPSRPSKPPVTIAPPPRVARGETIRPEIPRSMTAQPPPTSSSGMGWFTIAIFAFLMSAAAAVFLLLPRWAPRPGAMTITVSTEADVPADHMPPPSTASSPAPRPNEGPSLQQQAELKTRAEGLHEEALALRDALERRHASVWGGVAYRSSSTAIETGDEHFRGREYQEAGDTYQAAVAGLRDVETRGQVVLRQALADGSRALETGDSPAAIAAFELAASLDPGNGAAATGISRARVLNEVVRLLAEGTDDERRGDLPSARESYRKAISLDGHSQKARLALARAEGNITEVAFRTAMSKGLEALNQQDYPAARQFFQEAGTIKPGDSQVGGGIAQAEEGIRLQTIAAHREKALRFENEEQWHQAVEEYEAVLKLDAMIRFAQEGKARSDDRAALADGIGYHLTHAERLSDDKVLAAASAILEDADRIEPAGPRLMEQRAQLAGVLSQASTPVLVLLESDNETEVVVYKIGQLGRFERHTLQLRPGTYTVVGSRPGYRDVRVKVRVEAGKTPQPLIVRCEEKI